MPALARMGRKSAFLALLSLVAIPFLACGPGGERAITREEIDMQTIQQEIRQARAAVQDQKESLKRFRDTVEQRIVIMENTIDSIDRALVEMDRLLPATGVAAASAQDRAQGTGTSRWWIVLILLLVVTVFVIFALKYRQTQRLADVNAWPEEREPQTYAPPLSTPRAEQPPSAAGEAPPSPDTSENRP